MEYCLAVGGRGETLKNATSQFKETPPALPPPTHRIHYTLTVNPSISPLGFGVVPFNLVVGFFLLSFFVVVVLSVCFNCHEIYVLALSVKLKRINPHETDIKKHHETN